MKRKKKNLNWDKKSKWKREMNVQTEKGNKSPNKDWKK